MAKANVIIQGDFLGIGSKSFKRDDGTSKFSYSLSVLQELGTVSVSLQKEDCDLFCEHERLMPVEVQAEINDFADRKGYYLRFIKICG